MVDTGAAVREDVWEKLAPKRSMQLENFTKNLIAKTISTD